MQPFSGGLDEQGSPITIQQMTGCATPRSSLRHQRPEQRSSPLMLRRGTWKPTDNNNLVPNQTPKREGWFVWGRGHSERDSSRRSISRQKNLDLSFCHKERMKFRPDTNPDERIHRGGSRPKLSSQPWISRPPWSPHRKRSKAATKALGTNTPAIHMQRVKH